MFYSCIDFPAPVVLSSRGAARGEADPPAPAAPATPRAAAPRAFHPRQDRHHEV